MADQDTSGRRSDTELIRTLGEPSNVLIIDRRSSSTDGRCTRADPRFSSYDRWLYCLDATRSESRLNRLVRGGRASPEATTVILRGDEHRGGAVGAAIDPVGTVHVETLPEATDLRNLGVAITDVLTDWSESGLSSGMCFRGLETLVESSGLESVYKFLHVLTGRVRSSRTVAHYRLDPTTLDKQRLAAFRQLFDAIITVEKSGGYTIETRAV